mgnify:CR=1 FL=1
MANDQENTETVEQQMNSIALQKQAELEEHYKNICAQEVLYAAQLNQIQKQLDEIQEKRKVAAGQLEIIKSFAA